MIPAQQPHPIDLDLDLDVDAADAPLEPAESAVALGPMTAGRYERLTRWPLILLSLFFLAVYAWPILDTGLDTGWRAVCTHTAEIIWVAFTLDFLVRLALAGDRREFLRRNWLDLVLIALPMLRPLRALRAVVGLRIIGRTTAPFARRTVVGATALAVTAAGFIAALAILDAERANPDANIKTFGDALWWAIATITTVGYGDRYPTTIEGRFVAAGLMIAGIALLGVITASIASWFVERIRAVEEGEHETQETLQLLVAEVQQLRRELEKRDAERALSSDAERAHERGSGRGSGSERGSSERRDSERQASADGWRSGR